MRNTGAKYERKQNEIICLSETRLIQLIQLSQGASIILYSFVMCCFLQFMSNL